MPRNVFQCNATSHVSINLNKVFDDRTIASTDSQPERGALGDSSNSQRWPRAVVRGKAAMSGVLRWASVRIFLCRLDGSVPKPRLDCEPDPMFFPLPYLRHRTILG